MKIVLFANIFEYFGLRVNFLKKLRDSGFDVYLIASKDKFEKYFSDMQFKTISLPIDRKSRNPIKELYLLIRMFRTLKDIKPNIILGFTIKPVICCGILNYIFKIPVINTMTGLGPYFFKRNLFNFFIKNLFKISQKKINKVILQNKDDYDFFIKNNLIKDIQATLIPGFGINSKYFFTSKYPKNEKITFILIGRMLWNKGIGEYVEAAKMIKKDKPNFHFQLLGSIDKENAYCIAKEQIDHWKEEKVVEYLGYTDDVRPFISKADCVVLPSYREGMPRVLLQACAMGRPIITTNVPGCRDIIKDNQNGFICDAEDANSLKTALNKFGKLTFEEKEKMGLEARSMIENQFDEKIVFKSFLYEIQSLVK